MQGVMALYAREVATPELVSSAVKRFSPAIPPPAPNDHESALLYWVSQAVSSLCQRVVQEVSKIISFTFSIYNLKIIYKVDCFVCLDVLMSGSH